MIPPLLRRHWRLALAAGIAVAAFAFGRASAPEPSVQVQEKVVYRDRIVEVEKRVEVKVRDEAQVKRVVVYRDRIVEPDGTRREREVEASVTASEAREVATAAAERTAERETAQTEQRSIEVTAPQPNWRAGPLVGWDVPGWRPAYGAIVERRIVGPLSIGAWGLHTGTVGVAVTVEF